MSRKEEAPIGTNYIENLLESLNLTAGDFCELLGCDRQRLEGWRASGSILPGPEADLLADATGISFEAILSTGGRVTPSPIWQKARPHESDEVSALAAAHARILGARYIAVQALLGSASNQFAEIVRGMRESSSVADRPEDQAALASQYFLRKTGLGDGARPVGEVIRGFLRSCGFVVLEIPVRRAGLDGFLTFVNSGGIERPLIVANSYRTTWFRRNYVILHEVGHLLDADPSASIFDRGIPADSDSERRADSFALRTLVHERLLRGLQASGLRIGGADEHELAALVAQTHAEVRHIARAAHLYGMIDEREARNLAEREISKEVLEAATPHGACLSRAAAAHGYVREPRARQILAREKRRTEWPIKGLTVPVPFVLAVKDALDRNRITEARAAELLMVSEKQLAKRFGWQLR